MDKDQDPGTIRSQLMSSKSRWPDIPLVALLHNWVGTCETIFLSHRLWFYGLDHQQKNHRTIEPWFANHRTNKKMFFCYGKISTKNCGIAWKKMKHGGPASGRFANFRIEQIGCILFYEGGCDWKRWWSPKVKHAWFSSSLHFPVGFDCWFLIVAFILQRVFPTWMLESQLF